MIAQAMMSLLIVTLPVTAADRAQDMPPSPEQLRQAHHEATEGDPNAPLPAPGPRPLAPTIVTRNGFTAVQVNVDADGLNIPGDAANEPSIALDPTKPNRLAIGWRQFDTVLNSFRQAGWGYTRDGGRTWTYNGQKLTPGTFRSDPVLSADADGTLYYYSLQGNFLCDIFASHDGGMTWNGPFPAFGGDKAWLTVDRTGGAGDGNIYCAWSLFAGCCDDDVFIKSDDAGMSFTTPVPVPQNPIFGTLDTGPDGELYVVGVAPDFGGHLIAKSTSANTPFIPPMFDFTIPVNLGGVVGFQGDPNPAGLLGQAWVAVNQNNGHVYVLSSVDPPGEDPLDVHFIRSEDGGLTWSPRKAVNDDALNGSIGPVAWQWFGTMSVAPNGRIDVVWNDTRNSPDDSESELYYSFSTNEGVTWTPNVALTPPFDHSLGYPQQDKLGDYYDMVSDNLGADLAFAATFNGEQDVYYMRIGDRDCNRNDVGDSAEIGANPVLDCNENGIIDTCEIDAGTEADDNGNSIPDSCENLMCPADFVDPPGMVDFDDLAFLLGFWGPCPAPCLADIANADQQVDFDDLATLLGLWGPCP